MKDVPVPEGVDTESVPEGHIALVDQLVGALFPILGGAPPEESQIISVLSVLNNEYLSKSFTLEEYQLIRDTVNGYWSNFPVCCIKSFSVHGINGRVARASYECYDEVKKEFLFRYIPCADCFNKRNFIPEASMRRGGFIIHGLSSSDRVWAFIV